MQPLAGYPKQDDNYRGRYDFDRNGGRYSPGLFDAPAKEKEREETKKDAKSSAGGGAAGGGKADAKKPED